MSFTETTKRRISGGLFLTSIVALTSLLSASASFAAPVGKPAVNTTQMVSVKGNPPISRGLGGARNISVSADGDFAVFESTATDLDKDGKSTAANIFQVYLRNIATGDTTMLSVDEATKTKGANRSSSDAKISADGNYVVWNSSATDLTKDALNNTVTQVFLADLTGPAPVIKLVSTVHNAATTGAAASSTNPVISADGNRIAFTSEAKNLVNNVPAMPKAQVYFVDLGNVGQLNAAKLVSLADGKTGVTDVADADAVQPAISGNGEVIAFSSAATNLPDSAKDGKDQVFTRTVGSAGTGTTTTLVSFAVNNSGPGNQSSGNPSLSFDGSSIAFASSAEDLIANFGVGAGADGQIYLRKDSQNILVTANKNGDKSGTIPALDNSRGSNRAPSISDNGKYVAFVSSAPDLLVAPITNPDGVDQVYLRLVDASFTKQVSVTKADALTGGTLDSGQTQISPDAKYVGFTSTAPDMSDIAAGNGAGEPDTYLRAVDLTPPVDPNAGNGSGNGAGNGKGGLPNTGQQPDSLGMIGSAAALFVGVGAIVAVTGIRRRRSALAHSNR